MDLVEFSLTEYSVMAAVGRECRMGLKNIEDGLQDGMDSLGKVPAQAITCKLFSTLFPEPAGILLAWESGNYRVKITPAANSSLQPGDRLFLEGCPDVPVLEVASKDGSCILSELPAMSALLEAAWMTVYGIPGD
ncbi:MAG: hypothetical protein HQK58_13680 [Deltaproteobacteria bacterium]|nr:hypothetical protein [Deltaproteobacteria bacterium]